MNEVMSWQPSLTLMNEERIEQLHGAAVDILQEIGLNVHHPEMRAKLNEAGARLGEEARVYLSGAMVERALESAKKDIVVYDRLGEPAMELGPHQIYFGTGGASDSKLVDAQAGAEYAGSLLAAALAGTNLIHDVGYLKSGLTGSLESIVLGAEQIRWVKRFVDGFEVSEGTLAADALAEIGPAGEFLSHDHTFEYLHETMWQPYVTDHKDYDTWHGDGAKDYATRAREYGRELARSHQPQPVDDALDATLRELCNMEA